MLTPFEQNVKPRRGRISSACIMANSNREVNLSALMTRGGTAGSEASSAYRRAKAFVNKRFFLFGAATMVALARLAPSFGTSGGFLSLVVSKAGEGVGGTGARKRCVGVRGVERPRAGQEDNGCWCTGR